MMSEAQQIKTAASAWLTTPSAYQLLGIQTTQAGGSADGRGWRPTQSEMNEISVAIGSWLSLPTPSEALLESVSALFDRIAQASWGMDEFGERYELCSMLAFLGWRHAGALGRETESQAWLRISDLLATEPTVENESLSSFLFIPRHVRSKEQDALFLSSPLDIYLGLSILRRERIRPAEVVDVAAVFYDELLSRPPGELPAEENAFFLGELAFLAATCSRVMGKGRQCLAWNNFAHSSFLAANSNRPLLAKVRLVQATEVLDEHGYEGLNPAFARLELTFQEFEMPREALVCRLASAINHKKRGDNASAEKLLVEIVRGWRNSSEKSCFAIAASALAELRSVGNEPSQAAQLAVEALVAARESGDKCAEACAWSFIAMVHQNNSNIPECISALRTSARVYDIAPSQRLAAYTRILLAEILIDNRRWAEALAELSAAAQVIQSESMIPEGVHALKLLSMLPPEFSPEKASLRSSLVLIRQVEK